MISHWYWCGIGVVGFILLVIIIKFLFGAIRSYKNNSKLRKWEKLTKKSDKLIVHVPPKARTIPNASPFAMKLLTFLRMTGIPFEIDNKDAFGGKGKTPWISLEGENLADSEFIIAFLTKKYGKNLNSFYTEEQVAVATAVRIMLDEHFFWGMALERFVHGSAANLGQVIKLPALMRAIIKRVVRGRAESQGIGGHSKEDVVEIISKDIRTVSKILGIKQYILGDEPCAEDAGIFGQFSQFLWGLPNNPYEQLLNGDCSNIRDYCLRVKERFWPDWK